MHLIRTFSFLLHCWIFRPIINHKCRPHCMLKRPSDKAIHPPARCPMPAMQRPLENLTKTSIIIHNICQMYLPNFLVFSSIANYYCTFMWTIRSSFTEAPYSQSWHLNSLRLLCTKLMCLSRELADVKDWSHSSHGTFTILWTFCMFLVVTELYKNLVGSYHTSDQTDQIFRVTDQSHYSAYRIL